MKKEMTLRQAETSRSRGIRFVRDVLEDDDRADELDDESLDDWADRKSVTIVENPKTLKPKTKEKLYMLTKQQLEDRVAELEEREARILDALGIELEEEDEEDYAPEDEEE
ncbi:MAG: hypothetical protein ACKVZH_29375 [Blastocatellia bacterium]